MSSLPGTYEASSSLCVMFVSGEIRLCIELADATGQTQAEAQVWIH